MRYQRQVAGAVAALALSFSAAAFAQQAPDSLPGCIYYSSPPSLSDRQVAPWRCDINGKLITTTTAVTPGGSDTQLQYNNAGAFGGASQWTYNNSTGLLVGNFNAAAAPAIASGVGMQIVGTDATVARSQIDTFGAAGFYTIRRADGTGAAPTAIQSNDQFGAFNFHGYYVTGGPAYSGVQASFSCLATQNWTSTANGTKCTIATTPNGSVTLTTALTIDQDLSVTAAGILAGTNLKLSTGNIYPSANSTTALGIAQADGTTKFVTFDSTNKRVGINKTPGAFDLDVNGAVNHGGATTLGAALTYGGVALSNAVTGTGNMVLSASPTLTGTLTLATGTASGNFQAANVIGTASLQVSGVGTLTGSATGLWNLTDVATSGFGRFGLGPLTSSFPALKRSGTTVAMRLGDDSADAPISASTAALSGSVNFGSAAAGPTLKQGANGRVGTFVANGVTPVTVSNTSVAITDAIIISLNAVGGTVGANPPDIQTITAGVGFTVAGLTLDTSTYNYAIIKNAP